MCPESPLNFNKELDEDVKQKLHELHQKGININAIIRETLQKREQEIQRQKDEIAAEAMININDDDPTNAPPHSRYIPSKIKKIIREEYGTKCAISTCTNAAEEIHHTDRFSINKTHNPYFMAPLCQNHHKIAHTIDIVFHKVRQRQRYMNEYNTGMIRQAHGNPLV
jgi:hypothetical protein